MSTIIFQLRLAGVFDLFQSFGNLSFLCKTDAHQYRVNNQDHSWSRKMEQSTNNRLNIL